MEKVHLETPNPLNELADNMIIDMIKNLSIHRYLCFYCQTAKSSRHTPLKKTV